MSAASTTVAEQIADAIIKALKTNPRLADDVAMLTTFITGLEKVYAPLLVNEVKQFIAKEDKSGCGCFSGMCSKKSAK